MLYRETTRTVGQTTVNFEAESRKSEQMAL